MLDYYSNAIYNNLQYGSVIITFIFYLKISFVYIQMLEKKIGTKALHPQNMNCFLTK